MTNLEHSRPVVVIKLNGTSIYNSCSSVRLGVEQHPGGVDRHPRQNQVAGFPTHRFSDHPHCMPDQLWTLTLLQHQVLLSTSWCCNLIPEAPETEEKRKQKEKLN